MKSSFNTNYQSILSFVYSKKLCRMLDKNSQTQNSQHHKSLKNMSVSKKQFRIEFTTSGRKFHQFCLFITLLHRKYFTQYVRHVKVHPAANITSFTLSPTQDGCACRYPSAQHNLNPASCDTILISLTINNKFA